MGWRRRRVMRKFGEQKQNTNDKWHAGYFLTRDLSCNFYNAVAQTRSSPSRVILVTMRWQTQRVGTIQQSSCLHAAAMRAHAVPDVAVITAAAAAAAVPTSWSAGSSP